MIRKLSSEYVLAHSGFLMKCCPMAESLVILELEFLHIRGGCSLIVVFVFFLFFFCLFFVNFGSPFGRYPTFHTLTSVGRKKAFQYG